MPAYMEFFIQTIGWIGTFLVVLAYLLVSCKKLSATSSAYQLLNLFGVIGVGANVYYQEAWSALTLQVVWGIIAVISLIRLRLGNSL